MSVSTDAILFYGYAWDIESNHPPLVDIEDPDVHSDFDWDDIYTQRMELERPGEEFPGFLHEPTPEQQAVRDKYSAYWAAQREMIAQAGVELGWHCYIDCAMPYVAIAASRRVCYRGDIQRIESLTVGHDWDEKLANFCKVMGYDASDQKPGWYLVSYWH